LTTQNKKVISGTLAAMGCGKKPRLWLDMDLTFCVGYIGQDQPQAASRDRRSEWLVSL
jgi:hypothetical protein